MTSQPTPPAWWADPATMRTAAAWVIVLAGGWWVLGQLAGILRPILVAIFLGYVLLPTYRRLRTTLPPALAVGLIAGVTTLILMGIFAAVYTSLLSFRDEVPELRASTETALRRFIQKVNEATPAWMQADTGRPAASKVGELLAEATREAVSAAGGAIIEAVAVGLYLLFLLLESDRFGERVRRVYPADRAEHILDVAGRVNTAIVSFLKAKVKSSLVLAVPVWLVLMATGVRFALLWAVLTFLCNFIPYLGSVVAFAVPSAFVFLQMEWGVQPILAVTLLGLCHGLSAALVEPLILGRAVGLSPFVILASLSMWGALWGLPGMFLAVPLTMVLKIVAENLSREPGVLNAKLVSGLDNQADV